MVRICAWVLGGGNIDRSLVVLCLALLLSVIGTGAVAPVLAPYASSLGATGIWVGVLFSVFYVVRIVLGVPVGRLADRRGPKAILLFSMCLYPLIALAYGMAVQVQGLVLARLLHGLASAMLLPMAMAYIGEISPLGQEGRYMARYNLVVFLGNGIGPLLGGMLFDRWGAGSVFDGLLVLAVLAIGIIFSLPTVAPRMPEVAAAQETAPKARWRNPRLLALGSLQVQFAVLTVFMVSFFPLFTVSRGLTGLQTGGLLALYNLLVAMLQIPLGSVCDRVDPVRLISVSSLVTAALLALIPFANSLGSVAVLMVAVGCSSAVAVAAGAALSTLAGRRHGMGGVMGFLGTASSLGMIIGPLASGVLMDGFQIEAVLYFSAGVWVIGTLCFLLWSSGSESKMR